MYKILLFLGMLILLLCFFNKQEGFTNSIGKYDYLAPIPQPNIWTPAVINLFVDKFNSNMGTGNILLMVNKKTFATDSRSKLIMENALEEEANYYITNGKFPINLYVSDYLISNPNSVTPKITGSFNYDNTTISQVWPSRYIYDTIISINESKIRPLPESYEIFKGTKPPPSTTNSS
jgi:hypothetical protein